MTRHWTFGRRVGAGFALTLILAIAVGAVSAIALRSVRSSKDQITGYAARLTQTEQLRALRAQRSAELRSYTQTTEASHLAALRAARSDYVATVGRIRTGLRSGEERRLLDAVSKADDAYQRQLDKVTAAPETVTANADQTRTVTLQVDSAVAAFVAQETKLLNAASRSASNTTAWALGLVSSLTAVAVLLGILVAYLVTRTLNRQIGSTVGQVQSSAAELETAASQQATSAKEEATAMAQITTTMSELLSTSREIAGSAQRVSRIAEQTAQAARSGEATVTVAHESVTGIQRQVGLIVDHMLELGGKSQQIGAVLDIVAELAEQTNILAINATIEAAGAGESGARFAVVADEIRNLADRVAGSAKEIRDLIEEVRGAVNTTVMATETGSKTVDAGSRQFAAVADSFRNIAGLLSATNEAAREIELSTKQQATAVEQVDVGVNNVAQATRETEASASQTRQTSAQLADLSAELLRLVRPAARV